MEELAEPKKPRPEEEKNLGQIFDEDMSSDSFQEVNHHTYLEWLQQENKKYEVISSESEASE